MHGWLDMTDEEYHANQALGSNNIKEILHSPLHFKHRKPLEGPQLKFGSNLHLLISDPLAENRFIIEPKFDMRTNAGKAASQEFEKRRPENSICVSQDDYTALFDILLAVREHPVCKLILSEGVAERAGFYLGEDGIQRKIKPDWRKPGIIVDWKTTRKYSASPKKFKYEVVNYGYHISAAWYKDTANLIEPGCCDHFLLVAIEKESPYAICVHELDDETLELGREEYKRALEMYSNAVKTGKFEGYEPIVHNLRLPNFSFYKE